MLLSFSRQKSKKEESWKHYNELIQILSSIFTLHLDQTRRGKTLKSCFHLVDLAGSERQRKTGAIGQRFQEAKAINLSLSSLERVILCLSEKHYTFRSTLDQKFIKSSKNLAHKIFTELQTLYTLLISPKL